MDLQVDPRPTDKHHRAEGDDHGRRGGSRRQAAAGDERQGQEEGRGLGGVGAGKGPVRGQGDEQLVDLGPRPADEQLEGMGEQCAQAEADAGQQGLEAVAAGHRQGGHGQGRGQEQVQGAQPGDGQEKEINGSGWLHGGGLDEAGQGEAPQSLPPAQSLAQTFFPHRARVLLVEDNAINREVVLELLCHSGLVIETAVNGQEALERVRQHPYDLILMDIQMPLMDGYSATRAIRALPGRERIPILALTASAFEEDRQASESAGMNDFIAKPVTPAKLFEALGRWLPSNGMVEPDEQDLPRDMQAGPLAPLHGFPGLDLQQGLAALQGNQDKYLALLRHFASEHGQDMTRLHRHLQAGEHSDATRMVHSLRGVASTLGAHELSRHCLALEQAIADGNTEPTGLMSSIDEEIAALCALLGDDLAAPTTDLVPLGDQWRQQLLGQMEALLVQSDTAVIPLYEQYAGPLRLMLGSRSDTLTRQLKAFDFDAALLTLRQHMATDETHPDDRAPLPEAPACHPGQVKGDKGLNH